jgi:uncharacterized protein
MSGWNKRWLSYLLTLGLLVILVWLGGLIYPKYTIRMIGFGLFTLLDLLYLPVILSITKQYQRLKRTVILLYVLPFILFLLFIIFSGLWPLHTWPAFPRIYYPGLLILLFLWKFILIFCLLLGELFYLPGNMIRFIQAMIKRSKAKWKRNVLFAKSGMIAGGLMALLMLSGFVFWVYDFRVRVVEVPIKGLPDAFDGFRIVQLSDIHLGSWVSDKPLRRAMELTNQLNPDIIVFTGDLVNYTTDEAYPFRETLSMPEAPLGIYTILGNHDYGDYVRWVHPSLKDKNNQALADFYSDINWKLLNNQNAIIRKGNDSLAILGIENWSSKKMWGQRGKLAEAISGVEDVPVQILLSHDPTSWRSLILNQYPGIMLTLAGPTHAMQMGWETERFRWSPAGWLFPEWAGLYEEVRKNDSSRFLYVNRGLGHLGIPGRIGIRPEITLLILKKK